MVSLAIPQIKIAHGRWHMAGAPGIAEVACDERAWKV